MNFTSKKEISSSMILMITSIIWGFAFVAQVKASEANMGSFLFNGLRYILGTITLIPVMLLFEKNKITASTFKSALIHGIISGLVMMAAVNFQQYGINANMNAGKSGFITALYIVLIPLTGLFFKKKTPFLMWVSVALALLGMFFISIPNGTTLLNPNELLGDILVLVSAFLWTAQILCVDKFSKYPCPILFSVMQFAVCGLSSFIIAIFVDDFSLTILSASLAPVLYGGLISVAIGYTIQVIAQRHASPTIASIAMASESVFAAIGGYLVLHEIMTKRQLLGAGLVLFAILLSQISTTLHSKKADKQKTLA